MSRPSITCTEHMLWRPVFDNSQDLLVKDVGEGRRDVTGHGRNVEFARRTVLHVLLLRRGRSVAQRRVNSKRCETGLVRSFFHLCPDYSRRHSIP